MGYPDREALPPEGRTLRGDRALTRYEFAAGLNACMDHINELLAAGTADLMKKEDLTVSTVARRICCRTSHTSGASRGIGGANCHARTTAVFYHYQADW